MSSGKQYTGLKNKKILIVEDVELNQFLARHIMESWGCIVIIAQNGKESVDKINDGDFDLVLMDIQMPVMDGIEATKNIRALPDKRKSSVPIVALTANALKSESGIYLEAGMNDCLPKPFEEPALYNIVSKNIRKDKDFKMTVSEESNGVEVLTEEGKMYDLAMIESISGGNDAFVQKMLQLFLETVPKSLEEMRETSDKGDWKMLSKQAHKLKSTIDSMGILWLKHDIRQIEARGKKEEHPEGLPLLVDVIIEGMERVMKQVKNDYNL